MIVQKYINILLFKRDGTFIKKTVYCYFYILIHQDKNLKLLSCFSLLNWSTISYDYENEKI